VVTERRRRDDDTTSDAGRSANYIHRVRQDNINLRATRPYTTGSKMSYFVMLRKVKNVILNLHPESDQLQNLNTS